MRATLIGACLVAAGTLAGGCLVGPDFHQPQPPMPASWTGPTSQPGSMATTTQPTSRPAVTTPAPADVALWWQSFNDPSLNSLIQRGIVANLTLAQARERIIQARASRGIAASAFYPEVDGVGSYRRSGNGRTGTTGVYQAGVDASWELDVFGGVRRGIEAADASTQATIEDFRDVLVSLTSEIAGNYVDLRSFQRRLAIARGELESQRRSAALTRTLFQGGFVSGLDVANAESLVASTESAIPLLEQSERQVIYALSVLLALEPGTLVAELSVSEPIPLVPPEVPIGLPSELLRRRPDIRRAEANLHVATANVGVATADLFPRFTLNGSLSVSGNKLAGLGNFNNSIWSIGPSISYPLFDAGRIRSNINLREAIQRETFLVYEQTVLNALQETENALIAFQKEQEHRAALVDAVSANQRAVKFATDLYQQGQTDFLNVLSAQRSLLSTEDALVQSDRTMATNLISLYRALGGGWEAPPPAATVAPARQ